MADYQVLARKYRPQLFSDVLGQETTVTTLKNAIKHRRLAHAYLFCGSRGTGKTTLARVFSKALNCLSPSEDCEPCNHCSQCKDIASGHSIDVMEIDGASHRGIDDIRQINETVGYTASSGGYKIYIIDEVHMLTKDAFNALLKTLEEPPARVIFIFATTEPHKVLPTILSRCQRFNLNRIPNDLIVSKLERISTEMELSIDREALRLIASRAEGGLRDAESLLDQIIAFREGKITAEDVASILGIMPQETYFEIDKAAKASHLSIAFEIAHRVFSEGKDMMHFIDGLTEHYRNLLHVKLSGKEASYLSISAEELECYLHSASLYTQEQCLTILDHLIESQNQIRFMPSAKIALESLLLFILRIHQRIPIEALVRRLSELEQQAKGVPSEKRVIADSIEEDPTPKPTDLPKAARAVPQPPVAAPVPSNKPDMEKQSQVDTLIQFAAVELEGKVQKNGVTTQKA